MTKNKNNRQGIKILSPDDHLFDQNTDTEIADQSFEQLLEKSFNEKPPVPIKKTKQGVKQLATGDDLLADFKEKYNPDKSFEALLEESLSAESGQALIKDKIRCSDRIELSRKAKISSYPAPQEEIDLHGIKGDEAELKTDFFIRDAKARGLVSVRIIVGKGIHSQGRAVLPDIVEGKIIDLKREGQVSTFKWEKEKKRKSGSIIIWLS